MSKKDWTGNKGTNLTTNGFANLASNEREENDYYATEPKAIELLLKLGIPFHNVWENAVGGWHLANVLEKNRLLGKASDIIVRRSPEVENSEETIQTDLINFLEYNNPDSWDGDIITNPPYKYAKDWALKSIETVQTGHFVALFLPIRYLEGKARRVELFDAFPPKYVFVSTSRIKAAMNGDFDSMKGSAVTYTWIVWKKGYKGNTILKWFN